MIDRYIEARLLAEKNSFEEEILESLPGESASEFKTIHEAILKKSGLTDFYDRLKQL